MYKKYFFHISFFFVFFLFYELGYSQKKTTTINIDSIYKELKATPNSKKRLTS